MNGDGVSVIVPAYNEEASLSATVEGVVKVIRDLGKFPDYEILIFDDFSTDGTGKIADELSAKDPKVKVVHNERNMGFGYNYTKGVELASKEYVMMVPGDNEIAADSIAAVIGAAGQADIVVPYTANTEVRPLSRRLVSRLFTMLVNAVSGLHLNYYNGPCLHKSGIIKKVPMTTWGYAYMASILARLINSGFSYVEVPMTIVPRRHGSSKAFKPKNIFRVSRTLLELLWEIRVKRSKLINKAGAP